MLSNPEKIAVIDSLLEVLASARQRSEMYFLPLLPKTVENFLYAMKLAMRLCKINYSRKHEEGALKARGLEMNSLGFVPQLKKRKLKLPQIIDELLAVEMDIWRAYQRDLSGSTVVDKESKLVRGEPGSNCELTKSPAKRAAANKQTAAIQANFPRGLAQPALRALVNGGYTRLEQLRGVPADELLKLHGMGPKAAAILQSALNARPKKK